MCGFAGFFQTGVPESVAKEILGKMNGALVHRGPDEEGFWIASAAGIALGHRRLAVLDLTPAGHQPMISLRGRYVMVFNGEIYNHAELKERVSAERGVDWRGHSDTEILLAAVDCWGLERSLREATGMFALALWDTQEEVLWLARDRLGEKPLYHGWQGSSRNRAFLFSSDLGALRPHPSFEAKLDRQALCQFMRYDYVPSPKSIYEGIGKLEPGVCLRFCPRDLSLQKFPYWSLGDVILSGKARPFLGDERQAVDQMEKLLTESVGRQVVADVPVGAFLSGGIDSSTIVALMQRQSPGKVRTFTIGFREDLYNEAVSARKVAQHLGTDHTELYMEPDRARSVIPLLPAIYTEPFADPSQIPTFLVSQLARSKVTVSLSGDGGDELFGGYNRYLLTDRLWKALSPFPATWRRKMGRWMGQLSPEDWNRLFARIDGWIPRSFRLSNWGDKIHKGAKVLDCSSMEEIYLRLVSHWENPAAVVIGATEPPPFVWANPPALAGLGGVEKMMAWDIWTYLPDDILTKVDRAAMAVSLETRIPFLDHRIVEFAWRLPLAMKIKRGLGKRILRKLLERHVPADLVERPKMGFSAPISEWLRGPLRPWAEDLLNEGALRRAGWLRPEPIRALWQEHLMGQRNWQTPLWNVLMFQGWLESTGRN